MDTAELASRCDDDLVDAMEQMAAIEAAARAQLTSLVAAYDERKAWRADGATSMGAWLAQRLRCSFGTGAELARVARRLRSLPAISDALASGGLSWDQVVPLCRLAEPDTDEKWAARAPSWSPDELVRAARRRRPDVPAGAHPSLQLRTDATGTWMRVWGRVRPDDGALVGDVLDRLAADAPLDRAAGGATADDARRAEALVDLARASLAARPGAAPPAVVVHVDADTLSGTDDEGGAEVIDGGFLGAEAARRLACDARVEFWAERRAAGQRPAVIGIGRESRRIPAWLGRYLRCRDGGCRFPGCGRTRWTQAHHVVHWARGGPTDSSNLLTLCTFHHVALHEGGWRISGDPDGDVVFIRPDGRPLPNAPPGLRDDVRQRLPLVDDG